MKESRRASLKRDTAYGVGFYKSGKVVSTDTWLKSFNPIEEAAIKVVVVYLQQYGLGGPKQRKILHRTGNAKLYQMRSGQFRVHFVNIGGGPEFIVVNAYSKKTQNNSQNRERIKTSKNRMDAYLAHHRPQGAVDYPKDKPDTRGVNDVIAAYITGHGVGQGDLTLPVSGEYPADEFSVEFIVPTANSRGMAEEFSPGTAFRTPVTAGLCSEGDADTRGGGKQPDSPCGIKSAEISHKDLASPAKQGIVAHNP